ncbi:MAG: hypothetical protein V4649_03065 [Bacteroidota bacterium]
MKGIFTSYKVSDRYLSYISWAYVLFIAIAAYYRFPLSAGEFGDEGYYADEAAYLGRYDVYASLSQGTSFVFSLLIFLVSKACFVSYLIGARLLSVLFFFISAALFGRCLRAFTSLDAAGRCVAVVYFATICTAWVWKGLADIVCIAFIFGAFHLLTSARSMRNTLLAGAVLFLGFTVKPIVLFTIPGFGLYLLLNHRGTISFAKRALRAFAFLAAFIACFALYHVPGYLTYHKLMLESKDHHYVDGKRVENPNLWNEKNVYFEAYNPNNHPNKWAVSWEEVAAYKAQHPEVKLNLGYTEYVKTHTATWGKNLASKVFLTLPYSIQYGFFFAKWNIANHWLKSLFLVKFITLLIIAVICIAERRFIRENALLLAVPFTYYFILCAYLIPQLEDNWLLYCLPFLALPVCRFLSRYVHIAVLVLLQVVYVLL